MNQRNASSAETQIIEAISAPSESASMADPVGFLQELVRIDSCDPPGGELAVAKSVHMRMLALGLESDLDEFAPGRANVVARLRGKGKKAGLVLSAHMDTVPVGDRQWSRPPFSGDVENGRLFGRGSSDMKGALVAMITAASAIAEKGSPLSGDLILAFTAGESANLLGARRLVETGFQQEIGAFVCGEPSGLDIVIVEKAVLWLRVAARGRLGHVSGDAGINAIMAITDALRRLSTLTLDEDSHCLLDGPTIRVGRIQGGTAVNLTPDSCHADVDVRFAPGTSKHTVLAKIRAALSKELTIEVLDYKPAVESRPDDPLVSLSASICRNRLAREPVLKGVSYYSDAAVLLDGLNVPFIIIGPGDLGMSGQPDESIAIPNVLTAAQIYADIAEAWLS